MKKTILGCILASVLAAPVVAEEQKYVITTGKKGLSYNGTFGPNLSLLLAELGYRTTIARSQGAEMNLERIAADKADIGFAPLYVYASWMKSNPKVRDKVMLVGVLGKECLFAAVAEKGKVQDEDDIGEGIKVAVQKKGSGASSGWSYLRTLESDYAKASTYYKGGNTALIGLKNGMYDMVLWESFPDKPNKYLAIVNAENSGLRMMDLDDHSLNEEMDDGTQVFEFYKATTRQGFFGDTVEVPCAPMGVFVKAELDEDVIDELAGAVATNSARILGQ